MASIRGGGTPAPGASRRAAALALALAAAGGSACASAYASFRPEAEIPACRALLAERAAVPFAVRRVEAGEADGHPLFLEVEERGAGTAARLIVLVHGVLSDRRTWRYVVGPLAEGNDLLLVDLPGCGGSDRPPPDSLGPRGYDPDALARAVLAALRRSLERRPAGTRVVLAGHSLGGTVVLRMLGSPGLRSSYGDVLARVEAAVLVSPLDVSYAKRDPDFEAVVGASPALVAFGDAFGVVDETLAESVRLAAADPDGVPVEEVDRMAEILTDPPRLRAAQSMIRNAVPFTPALRPDWPRIRALERDYGRVSVPVLVLCGGRDDALPGALSFKIRQQLPRAWLRVLPRSGHSVPTEQPRECARLVLDFLGVLGEGWASYAEATEEAPAHVAAE
jgi:magnesium chelatase accessory protein